MLKLCLIALLLVLGEARKSGEARREHVKAVVLGGTTGAYYTENKGVFTAAINSDRITNTAFAAADFSTQTNGNAVVTSGMTVFQRSFGLNGLVFPSAGVGLAVGALASAGLNAPGATEYPNIILTIDQGESWLLVTGILGVVSAAALDAVPGTSGPYPPVSAGDYTAVYFRGRTGWAVGGNSVGLSATAVYPTATTLSSTNPIPVGYILKSLNGGTVWTSVPLLFTKQLGDVAYRSGGSVASSFYGVTVPGILFAVQSDSSGKSVYAVGSSVHTMKYTAPNVQVTTGSSGTIMTSTDAGATWATRTGPVLPSLAAAPGYALFGVAVLTSHNAVAVGGSPTVPEGMMSNGIVIRTVNGGLSWQMAMFPGSGKNNVPALTAVAAQPGTHGYAVWAGGFVTAANTVATKAAGAEFYPVDYETRATYNTNGVIYTVLVSRDSGATFVAASTSSFPPGFVQTTNDGTAPTILYNVFGIVWDNEDHGWIYGNGFILETHDGGTSWAWSTPNGLIVGTNAGVAKALASNPSLSGW